MKNQILITFILLIIFSCKEDVPEPSPYDVVQPQISQLSPDFLFTGDTLTITGSNFIDSNFDTKVFIDDVEYNVNSISNNEIQIEITTPMGLEQKQIKLKIGEITSLDKEFFIMPKQTWHPVISEGISKYYKVKIFPDTDIVYYLSKRNPSENTSYNPYFVMLEPTKNGLRYNSSASYQSTDFYALSKDKVFVFSFIFTKIKYTTDGFESSIILNPDSFYSTNIFRSGDDRFIDCTNELCIVTTGFGNYFKYDFNSDTLEEFNYTAETGNNIGPYRLRKIIKASDGFYYGVGLFFDIWASPYELYFLAMKSSNGFDDWSIIHQTAPYKNLSKALFVDSNLLYIIEDNKLMKSVDLGLNWELVEDNVSAIFMKNDTEWYKVSNDKLYYSSNAMASWEFEFDLPVGAEALSMDFTENKKIISGDGYMYIYYN